MRYMLTSRNSSKIECLKYKIGCEQIYVSKYPFYSKACSYFKAHSVSC